MFPAILKQDTYAKEMWETTAGGSQISQSIHGQFTGRRGDYVVIDDPFRGMIEARRLTQRNTVWQWYDTTILPRTSEDAVIVVVMTRWHKDDLIGRLRDAARAGGDQWHEIRFPAIAEHDEHVSVDDLYFEQEPDDEWLTEIQLAAGVEPDDVRLEGRIKVRSKGQALWPEQHSLRSLQIARATSASSGSYDAVYQQNPTDPAGSLIKRAWYEGTRGRYDPSYRRAEDNVRARYVTIDSAWEENETASYTGIVVGDYTRDRFLRVRTAYRERHSWANLPARVTEIIAQQDRSGKLRGILVENKASGIALISTLRATLPPHLASKVFAFNPKGDKDYRAGQASPWLALAQVQLPLYPAGSEPEWLTNFQEELFEIPGAAHRDQTDALFQLVVFLERYLRRGWLDRGAPIPDDVALDIDTDLPEAIPDGDDTGA